LYSNDTASFIINTRLEYVLSYCDLCSCRIVLKGLASSLLTCGEIRLRNFHDAKTADLIRCDFRMLEERTRLTIRTSILDF